MVGFDKVDWSPVINEIIFPVFQEVIIKCNFELFALEIDSRISGDTIFKYRLGNIYVHI